MPNLLIDKENIDNVFSLTQNILEKCPDRVAGTDSCRNAALLLKSELEKQCDENSTKLEEFDFHPNSFVRFVTPAVIILYIGVIFTICGYSIIGLILSLLPLISFLSQVAFYKKLFDPFFPKETGFNLIGKIEPKEEVKNEIIISAHYDAAYVFNILARYPKLHAVTMLSGLSMILISLISSLIIIISPSNYNRNFIITISILLVVFTPLIIGHSINFAGTNISPGAGDNLISCLVVNEISKIFGKSMKNKEKLLNNTRLVFISFDGEESGLRGSMAYVKQHREELTNSNINRYVINMDSLFKLSDMCILVSDLNGMVKLSEPLADNLVKIAENNGYSNIPKKKMVFLVGATDAVEFTKIGIESTSILGIHPDQNSLNGEVIYHTPRDLIENIEPEIIEAVLKILVDFIIEKDQSE